jgi:hypothetical protein
MIAEKYFFFEEHILTNFSFPLITADAGCDCGCVDSQVSRLIYIYKFKGGKNIPMLSPSPQSDNVSMMLTFLFLKLSRPLSAQRVL